jgi:alpha-1,6-mannosyltransferase
VSGSTTTQERTAAVGMWRLAGLGVLLIGLTLAGLSLHRPGAIALPSLRAAQAFVAISAVAAGVYFAAAVAVLRRPMPRGALWLVLGVALAMRVLVLPAPPLLSSDMYRYVWDGKVQNAGISPYRYIPGDPKLAKLRDAAIYPHIGRVGSARTIYPPAAQLVFRLVAAISPTVLAMKAIMVGFELLGIGAIIAVLGRVGLPRERVLIYAWNPLTVWAFAGNGHADAIAIGLIGLALLARSVRRDGVTGALLGAATLVKFIPGAVAPAFWRRWDWRLPAAAAAVIVVLYTFYIDVGWRVLGFLPGYAREEGLDSGTGFWLLAGLGDLFHFPAIAARIYTALAVCALAGLAIWIAFRPRPEADGSRADMVRVGGDAALLAAATMLALSPHYSWYYAWLALPCCLCPRSSLIYLSAAGLLLDINPLNEHFLWPCLLFVPTIALGLRDLGRFHPARAAAPVSLGSRDAIGRSP